MATRLSTRSTIAPASNANRNHGSVEARSIAAMRAGSRVMVAAIRGSAVNRTPSPRLETELAIHSLR